MLEKKVKDRIIAKFATHPGDTGSAQVQIAILTKEINELIKHLRIHKKDFSSRRGLLQKVNRRRKLLNYLEREEPKNYKKLVEALKLKR
jgi:small subunit ribosomal protein S15